MSDLGAHRIKRKPPESGFLLNKVERRVIPFADKTLAAVGEGSLATCGCPTYTRVMRLFGNPSSLT